jgi:two-component system, sensor histidine kinase PdtaS
MRKIKNPKREDTEIQTKILASIAESSEDAIITTSNDGVITSWNKNAEQIYGYSDTEVLGKPISILESSTSVGEMQELIELIKQEDRFHHYETLQLRNDRKMINASLTLSPIIDASESLIYILIIARDITKSKETEEKLQKIEEKLRKTEETYNFAMEHTRQIIYDYDLRTDKCIWAGAIEEVTGYSFGEFQMFGF